MQDFSPETAQRRIAASVRRLPDKSVWIFQCLTKNCQRSWTVENPDPNAKTMGYYCAMCRRPYILYVGYEAE
jgi:hypothetical protein